MNVTRLIQSVITRIVTDAFIIWAMAATKNFAYDRGNAAVVLWLISFPIPVVLSWSDWICQAASTTAR